MNVDLILEKMSDMELIRLNRPMERWYSIYCPFHNGGNEKRPSAGVTREEEYRNGVHYEKFQFHCFACSRVYSGVQFVTEVLKTKNISQDGLTWLKENIPGFEIEESEFDYLIPQELMNQTISRFAVQQLQQLEKPQKFISEEELAKYRFTVPYMYERKLTDEIIEEYDIGFQADWIPPGRKKPVPCITIPIRDRNGRTLFFCRRSVEGKLYNYPEGVTKPVFGIDRVQKGKPVVICESAINALTARVYGYQSVALLGTGNTYQIQQLKELGVDEFVICMDGDEAGHKATEKLKRVLSKTAIIWVIHMPDGKDLNDCTKREFDELYSERD